MMQQAESSHSEKSSSVRASHDHPYAGRSVSLATKHGKEGQIAPAFAQTLQMRVEVPAGIDTDVLGTFTGEIPRTGSPMETVYAKARLGMQISGSPLGLANEGSFGPHPAMPLMLADTELLLFIDDERGIKVQEVLVSEKVVAAQCTARTFADLGTFLEGAHFPSHALIVRPEGLFQPDLIFKAVTDPQRLEELITLCAAESPAGLAHIESDLRAHMNPTRRRVLSQLAEQLAQRLARLCPHCATPGWGIVDHEAGLPCSWCGQPTELVRALIFGCPACTSQERHGRPDGLQSADAGQCPFCNP
ncbi:DUF6671 family protein [Dictyobacter aurantiacus]|uniref:DUF6671 domain-containing protein n=1 Tax=Dictyobacter aurantiacus TaxID=1936993 RepID=A0A401ZIW4_9CHLR|nr:DUF6671 family protein [Dictyobacter aurantiacus]GCE06801.1 hypothetical protein KDAU_41300 [Dictyobacter aurantiacus]